MKRSLKISFRDNKDLISFIEYLNKNLPRENIYIISEGKNVKIIFRETERDKVLFVKIKKLYEEWKELYYKKDKRRIPLLYILRESNLRTAIPVSVISEVLNLMGYVSKIEDMYLISDVDLEVLKDIVRVFSEKYRESLLLKAEPLAKRLISMVATVKRISIEESIRYLVELGLLKMNEDKKKYVLLKNYQDCLDILSRKTEL